MCQVEQISKSSCYEIRLFFKRCGGRIPWGDTMNNSGKAWLIAFVMGMLIPGLMFSVSEKLIERDVEKPLTEPTAATQPIAQQPSQLPKAGVTVLTSDGPVVLDMQTYLTGVLLAEMPVDFSPEALKAQAVVSRTYALRQNTVGNKHSQGAVCTDSTCCQAYRSTEDFLLKGGTPELLTKVTEAVKSTDKQVLTYNGVLIEATYFSCSGGKTEDAMAVWGTDIPYLQSVSSPGEEGAAHFVDAVQFTAEEFASLLGISPRGSASGWLGAVTYTEGGGVATMVIDGKTLSGTDIRQKLGLRSTVFTMLAVGDTIHISTRGYGHRVGMSQYGAEAMAVRGSDYPQILSHYYPGTRLSLYTQN